MDERAPLRCIADEKELHLVVWHEGRHLAVEE